MRTAMLEVFLWREFLRIIAAFSSPGCIAGYLAGVGRLTLVCHDLVASALDALEVQIIELCTSRMH